MKECLLFSVYFTNIHTYIKLVNVSTILSSCQDYIIYIKLLINITYRITKIVLVIINLMICNFY